MTYFNVWEKLDFGKFKNKKTGQEVFAEKRKYVGRDQLEIAYYILGQDEIVSEKVFNEEFLAHE